MNIINNALRLLFDLSPILIGPKLIDLKTRDIAINNGASIRTYEPYIYKINRPIVLYFHGGGWIMGSIKAYDRVLRYVSYNADCIIVAVEYRKAPESKFPAALNDCYEGYRWVIDNLLSTDEKSKDSNNNIIFCGDSAGGNLAIGLLKKLSEPNKPNNILPSSLILIYPLLKTYLSSCDKSQANSFIYALSKIILKYSLKNYLRDYKDYSSPYISFIDNFDSEIKYPKTLIITAKFDALTPSINKYIKRLKNLGVEVLDQEYSSSLHGFINFGGISKTANKALRDIVSFIK